MLVLAQYADSLRPTEPWLFYVFAAVSVAGALGVVLSAQIVRMAVFLLFTLGGVAFLYFLLDAEFLAAIQLIVYVGGTLILIIFGVMLTSKNPFIRLTVPWGQRIAGWGIGAVLALLMVFLGVYQVAGPARDGEATGAVAHYGVEDLGRGLLTTYALPFEVAGMLLLVVMIGAAYLAKGRHDALGGEGGEEGEGAS